MTTTAPVANARDLALAHYAARGVLEHVLARHGATFQQQVALRAAVAADTPQAPDDLLTQVRDSSRRIRPTSAPRSTSCWPSSCSSPTVRTFAPRMQGASCSPPSARRSPPSPPASGAGYPPRTWPPQAASSPWSPSVPTRSSRH